METIKIIVTILELIFTVGGAIFALWLFLRNKRNDTIKLLAKQVLAYNSLEQELLKELTIKENIPLQTLQKDFRKKALNNVDGVSSFMTPSKARSYLSII